MCSQLLLIVSALLKAQLHVCSYSLMSAGQLTSASSYTVLVVHLHVACLDIDELDYIIKSITSSASTPTLPPSLPSLLSPSFSSPSIRAGSTLYRHPPDDEGWAAMARIHHPTKASLPGVPEPAGRPPPTLSGPLHLWRHWQETVWYGCYGYTCSVWLLWLHTLSSASSLHIHTVQWQVQKPYELHILGVMIGIIKLLI